MSHQPSAISLSLNADIFKAYDVRGVYPSEINEDAARAIGAAFSAYLEAKRIAVGRDMRLSSPALAAAFIDGATSRGTDVVDYGMISTDMLYFAVARDGHDGGVQITASHNPKQYNGMKMVRQQAFPLSGEEGLKEIRDIVERVSGEKADVGIAWDGDADRCFFIDGTGAFVSGDFITALLAEAFLIKHPGASIVYDLRASHAVKDTVARYGGTALMNRVGHAFFKRRMRETNAIFGGEVTGHYYFRDNFYADNGFIPALLMLELMSKKGQPLHDLLKPLAGRYFISGEINTKLARMDLVPARLATIAARYADGHQYELDGLSVEYPDWHFNVRPSNTEPLLRLNLEATTSQMMERKRDEVLALIRT